MGNFQKLVFFSMKKSIFISLLFSINFSCQKKISFDDTSFRNKTFIFNNQEIHFQINFYDSTAAVFELDEMNISWNTTKLNDNYFLILNSLAYEISKKENGDLVLQSINNQKNTFIATELKPIWNKEKIYGTWFDKEFIKRDSSSLILLPNFSDKSYKTWPPIYIITKDSIFSNFYAYHDKSSYKIDHSNKLLKLNLNNEYTLEKDILWRIIKLTDSTLIIERSIKHNSFSVNQSDEIKKLELIKKR